MKADRDDELTLKVRVGNVVIVYLFARAIPTARPTGLKTTRSSRGAIFRYADVLMKSIKNCVHEEA